MKYVNELLADTASLDQLLGENSSDIPPLQKVSVLFEMLDDKGKISLSGIEHTKLKVGSSEFIWVHGDLPAAIQESLPITSHRIAGFSKSRFEFLKAAYEHLRINHPGAFDLVANFSPVITWAELKPEFLGKDSLITSSSFPALPLVSWISDKALRHIPPNNISDQPEVHILAENIFHEAIHQRVNLTLLTREIFVDDFEASTAPKLPIAWRSNQSSRQQNWELDRVLHAIFVYSGLVEYRGTERSRGDHAAIQAGFLDRALSSGRDALNYLIRGLFSHGEWFTSEGQGMLKAFRAELVG